MTEEQEEIRQLVLDAYQLHRRMERIGACLPALLDWAARLHHAQSQTPAQAPAQTPSQAPAQAPL